MDYLSVFATQGAGALVANLSTLLLAVVVDAGREQALLLNTQQMPTKVPDDDSGVLPSKSIHGPHANGCP